MSKRILLNLKLFDEGAGAAGTAGGTSGVTGTGEGTVDAAQTKVVYGKQAETNADKESVKSEGAKTDDKQQSIDNKSKFLELIASDDYKDVYKEHMQGIVKDRLKGYNDLKSASDNYAKVIDKLAIRYGVDPSNIEAVMSAIDKDDAYLESQAMEQGMSTEQFKRMKQIEYENQLFKRQNASIEQERATREKFDRMMEDVPEIKTLYPSFDFVKEIKNPDFARLINNNIPLRTAYEVIHKDEITQSTLQYAVQKTKEQVSNDIQSGQSKRVPEGGSGNGIVVKSDVTKLTKKDRQEIAKRAAGGERISF